MIVRSGLNEEDTERLRNITDYLGGILSETWDNSCTHLTVAESVLFTTKVRFFIILRIFFSLLKIII